MHTPSTCMFDASPAVCMHRSCRLATPWTTCSAHRSRRRSTDKPIHTARVLVSLMLFFISACTAQRSSRSSRVSFARPSFLSDNDRAAYMACLTKVSPRFLDMPRPHVALASYPRSGSSLLRASIEYVTERWTGSDACRTAESDGSNREAEGVSGSRVWLVKTNSILEKGGPFAPFTAHRILLLVRNPFKVAVSYWHYVLSGERQGKSVPLTTFKQFPLIWSAFCSQVKHRWRAFYRFWLVRSAQTKAPLRIVRYEELSQKNRISSVISDVHNFLYSEDSFAGSSEPESERPLLAEYLRRSTEYKTGTTRLECLRKGYYSPIETKLTNKNASTDNSHRLNTRGEMGASQARLQTDAMHELNEAFSDEHQRTTFRDSLRLELCLLGYGSESTPSAGDDIWIGNEYLHCTDEETHAVIRGEAINLIFAAAASTEPRIEGTPSSASSSPESNAVEENHAVGASGISTGDTADAELTDELHGAVRRLSEDSRGPSWKQARLARLGNTSEGSSRVARHRLNSGSNFSFDLNVSKKRQTNSSRFRNTTSFTFKAKGQGSSKESSTTKKQFHNNTNSSKKSSINKKPGPPKPWEGIPPAVGQGISLNSGSSCRRTKTGDVVHEPGKKNVLIGANNAICGADLHKAGDLIKRGRHESMLTHPVQALACIRLAASARNIDISMWDDLS